MKHELKILKHQNKLLKSKAKHIGLLGGYGAGKSDAGILWVIIKYLKYGNQADIGIWEPTFPLLKAVAIPKVIKRLSDMNLKFTIRTQPPMKLQIEGYSHSIFFASFDRPETLIGYELLFLLIDELDTIKKEKAGEVFKNAVARTRFKLIENGEVVKNQIAVVTTPDQGMNGFCCQYFENTTDPDVELIRAKTSDNIFAPPDLESNLEKLMTPEQVKAFLNGFCVNFNSLKVYKYFTKENISQERISPPQTIYVGLDFNIGGTCAVLGRLERDKLVIFDEVISYDTHDFVNNIKAKYQNHTIIVVPDSSGFQRSTNSSLTDIQIITKAGFFVEADISNPLVRDRVNNLNVLLMKKQVVIQSNCKETIFALENQGYDKNNEPEKSNKHPAIDDWNDALGYLTYQKMNTNRQIKQLRSNIL